MMVVGRMASALGIDFRIACLRALIERSLLPAGIRLRTSRGIRRLRRFGHGSYLLRVSMQKWEQFSVLTSDTAQVHVQSQLARPAISEAPTTGTRVAGIRSASISKDCRAKPVGRPKWQ